MICYGVTSTLFISNCLGDRENAPIRKGSNYRDSNDGGFLLEDFQGSCKFSLNQQNFELHEFELNRVDCSFRLRMPFYGINVIACGFNELG